MTLQCLRTICYSSNRDSEDKDFYPDIRVWFNIVSRRYYLRYAKVSCVIDIKYKGSSQNLQWIYIIHYYSKCPTHAFCTKKKTSKWLNQQVNMLLIIVMIKQPRINPDCEYCYSLLSIYHILSRCQQTPPSKTPFLNKNNNE